LESLNINTELSYTGIGTTNSIVGVFMQDNQKQAQPWIYAAAIMDSDGCFMIAKYRRKTGNYYLPSVKITMIQDGAINYITKELGMGRIHLSGPRKSRPNSQPLYEWTITNRPDLLIFLKGIMPYLQNKKNRAEHLLSYCTYAEYRFYGSRWNRLSDQEVEYREEAYQQMRKLNIVKAAATTKSSGRESACDSLIS
jgi:hypothetical protein